MPPYRYRIPISSQPASSIIGCYSGQKPAKRRSLSTSLKPARHGVYDFWTDDAAAKAGKARSAHVLTHRKGGDAIWNMLSEYGKQMLVVNVPMTYPPGAVNGIMVSGYTMPGAHVDFTHPSTCKGELYRAVPGYQIDLDVALREHLHVTGKVELLTDTVLCVKKGRIKPITYLLREKSWDFCYLAFMGAGRLQHPFWEEVSGPHPSLPLNMMSPSESLPVLLIRIRA